jgi:hypothetical protein
VVRGRSQLELVEHALQGSGGCRAFPPSLMEVFMQEVKGAVVTV